LAELIISHYAEGFQPIISPFRLPRCAANYGLSTEQKQCAIRPCYTAIYGTKGLNVLLWPFRVVWKLLARILPVTGRILLLILGLTFVVARLTLAMTLVAVPLAILRLLLMIRSIS
jgi:hypothetical protein